MAPEFTPGFIEVLTFQYLVFYEVFFLFFFLSPLNYYIPLCLIAPMVYLASIPNNFTKDNICKQCN